MDDVGADDLERALEIAEHGRRLPARLVGRALEDRLDPLRQRCPVRDPVVEVVGDHAEPEGAAAIVDLGEVEAEQLFETVAGVADGQRHGGDRPRGRAPEIDPLGVSGFLGRLDRPGEGQPLDPSSGKHSVSPHVPSSVAEVAGSGVGLRRPLPRASTTYPWASVRER